MINNFRKKMTCLAFLATLFTISSAQSDFICGMSDTNLEGISSSSVPHFQDLPFFPQSACGKALVVNCRFVFFTKGDGSGTFPQGEAETLAILDEYVKRMNFRLANIRDPEGCAPNGWNYDYDSNVRVKVTYDYVVNEEAYDYHARASQINNYSSLVHPFCPDPVDTADPANSTWPALRQAVRDYNLSHPNSFNIFFVEDGNLINTVEQLIATGQEPTGEYTEGFDIFSGCSRSPDDFYDTPDQFIIMTDFYAKWLSRKHFGSIYLPDHADEENDILAQWHLDEMPGTTVHEMGHCLLWTGHRFDCDNIMHIQGAYRTHLDPNQLNDLHRFLMSSNLHNYIDCSSITEETCDLIIDHDVTIDEPMAIYGDIIVKEGVELNITSDIYFSETSSIIMEKEAKLITNNALLSSYCDGRWDGIHVTGGNDDFDVQLFNTTIENASQAITTRPPLPWSEAIEYGNGIIHADNTTFNNVGRLAEMMAFQPSINNSYFRSCVQNGGKLGITNWNCQYVEVSNCEFNDIEEYAVVSSSASFLIEGNTFNNGNNDILFVNGSGAISSTIIDNDFLGSKTAIRLLGSTFNHNTIQNNRFASMHYDIWAEGDNFYTIENNDLTALFGIVSANNGSVPNLISENSFVNDIVGIRPAGSNMGLNFVRNCFETGYSDTYINGQIAPIISDGDNPANNCFTHEGNEGSDIFDLGGTPDSFTYYEPNDSEQNCLNAIFAPTDVTRGMIGILGINNICSIVGSSGIIDVDNDLDACNPANTIADCIAAKNWLTASINQLNLLAVEATSEESENLESLRNSYYRCLAKAKRKLFELYIKEAAFAEARAVFNTNTPTDDERIAIFSSYLFEGDLNGASTYLTASTENSEQYNDFISTQLIHLNHLRLGPNYVFDTDDQLLLHTIAHKEHPYATYAKSLIFMLTQKLIETELPRLEIEDKNKNIKLPNFTNTTQQHFKCLPNPVSDLLSIQFTGYEQAHIHIVDLSGNIVYDQTMANDTQTSINVTNWKAGVYFVQLIDKNGDIARKKIIVQHL